MNQQDLISMSYNFLSILFEQIGSSKIRKVILFGSVARNEFDKDSDVDIFVDSSSAIEPVVNKALKSFEVGKGRQWSLKGIDLPIKIITGDLQDKKWAELTEEMNNYSIVLFGKSTTQNRNTSYLVSYSLKTLDQKTKVRLLRELYGYKTKKNGKTYTQEGLVKKEKCARIGIDVIQVPIEARESVEQLMKMTKVKYQIRMVWF